MSSSPPRKVSRSYSSDSCLRSSFAATNLKKCITCQADKTRKKDMMPCEALRGCTWEETPATFVCAARQRNDKRILIEIEGTDLNAKDVLYPPLCFKNYTASRTLQLLAEQRVGKDLKRATVRRADSSRSWQQKCKRLHWMTRVR